MQIHMTALTVLASLALMGPAFAHPHVFIDTKLDLHLTAEGQIEAVTVTWTYDELFTLLVLEERGLDPDGDGLLTANETASLSGFDMNWLADFPGDTYVLFGASPVALSPPQNWSATVDGGRIASRHTRRLAEPLGLETAPVVLKSYDPEFYTAYRITEVTLDGANPGCSARIVPFDPKIAEDVLSTALSGFVESPDTPFPLVGAYFADRVEVTCLKS